MPETVDDPRPVYEGMIEACRWINKGDRYFWAKAVEFRGSPKAVRKATDRLTRPD